MTKQAKAESEFGPYARSLGFELTRYSVFKREPSWWSARLSARLASKEAIGRKNPYAGWFLQILLGNPLGAFGVAHPYPAARKATRRDVLEAASRIPPIPPDKNPLKPRAARLMSFPYDWEVGPYGQLLVAIDVLAPDDAIESKIALILREHRKEAGVETRRQKTHRGVTVEEMARWETSQLLPYLDLLLVSEISGIRVTESDLVRILFSTPDTDLLNTAQAQAKRMLNRDFIHMLATQGNEPRPSSKRR
jgi:hypothetical protein